MKRLKVNNKDKINEKPVPEYKLATVNGASQWYRTCL